MLRELKNKRVNMFRGFKKSLYKEIVSGWKQEHKDIIKHCTNIIESYDKGLLEKTKGNLRRLEESLTIHFIKEGNGLEEILERPHNDTIDLFMVEFLKNFGTLKKESTNFFEKYKSLHLNSDFMMEFRVFFNDIAIRIDYEEKNLYKVLEKW